MVNSTLAIDRLASLLTNLRSLVVLTGAGCSTSSGIPDYRDQDGNWKNAQPMQFSNFIANDENRQRYWKRSLAGWNSFGKAIPNSSHEALVELERMGVLSTLITQNVDRLHQKAGHENVIDLHGRLDLVRCIQCDTEVSRDDYQKNMLDVNSQYRDWLETTYDAKFNRAPDGDSHIFDPNIELKIIPCSSCGGVLKPDVVFFGESVPKDVVTHAFACVDESEMLLVVGSSLMVYSGFRFCRYAAKNGKPVVIIGYGKTRGDELASLKITGECGAILKTLIEQMV